MADADTPEMPSSPSPAPPSPSSLLELDSLPDSPLLQPTLIQPQPKWLLPSSRRSLLHKLYVSTKPFFAAFFRFIRPRFAWKYILLLLATLYVSTCFIRGSPLLASSLPPYDGPWGVGSIDLEIPVTARNISDTIFKDGLNPAFEIQSVLFTLYYPIDKSAKSLASPKQPWIAKPISLTARGYAKFAHVEILSPIFTFLLWLIAGGITIPTEVDAPFYTSATEDRSPVIVFSHGMASSRTDYTHYIGQLASRGSVVAAIEHRDGSCPGSLVLLPQHPPKHLLHFRESDLLLSNHTPVSTPRLKFDQLAFRDAEILETISLLSSLSSGHGPSLYKSSSRGQGVSLSTFANRLELTNLLIAGHSYGATAALQALKSSPVAKPVAKGGIVLDPGKESGPLNALIDVPLLVVHSNSWSKKETIFFGRPHFDTVRELVLGVLNRTGAAWFLTSLGTSHPSVSDAPLIEPLLLSWTTGANLDVRQALHEYVHVSDAFVKYMRTQKLQGVLSQEVTHEAYGKWVSDARRSSYPANLARLWEIHVSPAFHKDSPS